VRVGIILSLFALFFIISVPSAFADYVYIGTDKSVYTQFEDVNIRVVVDESGNVEVGIKDAFGNVLSSNYYWIDFLDSQEYFTAFSLNDYSKPAGTEYNVYAIHGNEYSQVTIYSSNFGTTIELDQKVYSPNDIIEIIIVAPDYNNYDSVDYLEEYVNIIASTSIDSISLNNFKELRMDGGVFEGTIKLTTGYTSGENVLSTTVDDKITIELFAQNSKINTSHSLIQNNIGEVQWIEESYPINGIGQVRIIDADLNVSASQDVVIVNAYSDSDQNGIDVTLSETDSTTGIFEGSVRFTDSSIGRGLYVGNGDIVTVEYLDYTLPAPYTSNDVLDISAITFVGQVSSHLDRYSSTNLRITDEFGNMLDTVSPNQQVNLTIDVTNLFPIELQFVYWIEISGAQSDEMWIYSSLESGQPSKFSQSWIPPIAGTYSITAHVVDTMVDKNFLAESQIMTISVSDYSPRDVPPEPVVEQVVNCGPGTEAVVNSEFPDGICQVIQTEESTENGGGCLIATATYGSEMAPQVQQLRELRDNQLLQTESGTAFMNTFNDIYYSFSPIIADYERENPLFKEAVKLAITPMISSLSLMENAESESEVLSIGISVIMLNIGMYLGIPAIVVIGIRKRF
jgi:hypothetical protein